MINDQFTKEQLIKQLNEIYYRLSVLELKEKEPIYQAFDKIVDMSPVGIVFVNKDGKIINANSRAEEILGLENKSLKTRTYNDPIWRITDFEGKSLPDDALPFNVVMKTKKPVINFTHAIEWPNGNIVYLAINATPYFSKTGETLGMLAIIEDITSSVLIEKQIRKEHDLIRNYLDVAGVMLVVIRKDEKIIEINKRGSEILELPQKEILGKNWFEDFIPEKDREEVRRIFTGILDGKVSDFKFVDGKIINSKGETRIILWHNTVLRDSNGQIYATLSSGNDITERVIAEQKLKQSEEKYRRLFQNMRSGFAFHKMIFNDDGNPIDYLFLEANKEFERITGILKEDLIGKRVTEVVPDIMHQEFDWIATYSKVVEAKREISFEQYSEHFNKWFQVYAYSPQKDHFATLFFDITEKKNFEKSLFKLNEQLETRVAQRTSQLESLNSELKAFSYSVSHDLRAPIRRIKQFSNILLNNYQTDMNPKVREYLGKINESSVEMETLIDDFLNLSRISDSSLKLRRVNLSDIVKNIADKIQEEHRDRIKFKIQKEVYAKCDRGLLTILLENLISNAVKFAKDSKKLVIDFGVSDEYGSIIYFVKDNGIGFDMKYQEKLFTPFQRLHSDKYEGSGIGLATVKRVINMHKGKVWAEGRVNKGATFYFTLPS